MRSSGLIGIHTVNRVCYLVTEVAHDWQEIELKSNYFPYRTCEATPIASHSLFPDRGYALTGLGLLLKRLGWPKCWLSVHFCCIYCHRRHYGIYDKNDAKENRVAGGD